MFTYIKAQLSPSRKRRSGARRFRIDVTLERINPNVILMFDAYRQQRRLLPRCVVRDATYGTVEVYEVGSVAKRGEP